jgi:branched-chain amino acid transport system substrate-binding protein
VVTPQTEIEANAYSHNTNLFLSSLLRLIGQRAFYSEQLMFKPSSTSALPRRAALTLTAMSAALLLSGCQYFNSVPSTVKIGVAQPLSGPLAALGGDLLNGVKLAVDELNKQGYKIAGKSVTLEVVAMDDKANPEEGKKVAQQLVDAGIVAVVGHLNSGVSIPAAPIYAEKGIAQLAISTNPKFTELGFPTTLRIVANDTLQARAVGSYAAANITGTKFAVVDDGTPYGKGLADSAAKELEGKKTIALRQSFDDKTKDFAALADKLKADGIEVVVSTLNDFQVIALIEALKKIDYNKSVTIMGTDTLKTTEMLKYASEVKALLCTSGVLEAGEFQGGAAFLQAYQAAFKIPPAYGGHYAYDATHAIAAAMRRAESADPKKVSSTLRSLDAYAPVTGSFKWDDKGELRYATISVYGVNGGKWNSLVRSDKW